ncbi:hypothetical protein F9L16_02125 [Agarivorans sp. B2Z047]|uniref:peptidoglycan-binding domain-containing protein n=1 Tax=Agarivorans sp. B2Z047 TaxID=2652721 RepID=UPI00128D5AF3|nr:hypothetical protein [Agarivorans sp. B2Z047]MPW27791.1 hypothetical protein [Agarivorans sp. B2Z047]UQN44374.1 hypothetical protein LQZ07_07845 [Agarivorans sp. B2Z047]
MQLSINYSVGRRGLNADEDVKLIQVLLNCYRSKFSPLACLAEDGKCDRKTVAAIDFFQRNDVKMKKVDGRVDPNGTTFSRLTRYFKPKQQADIAKYQNGKLTWERLLPGLSPSIKPADNSNLDSLTDYLVTYKSDIAESARIVSEYSKKVIKLALKEAGMKHAVITSTLRTPAQQAAIMYRNAKANLQKQYRLYGSVGDRVLDVYAENSSKGKSEVIKLMEEKILAELASGNRTSKHCVSISDYKNLNIIDIGVNSTRAASLDSFNKVKFTNALKALKTEGYISGFIDETSKSNQCWHIEIKPNVKTIQ